MFISVMPRLDPMRRTGGTNSASYARRAHNFTLDTAVKPRYDNVASYDNLVAV
jgi:hypothetical protein